MLPDTISRDTEDANHRPQTTDGNRQPAERSAAASGIEVAYTKTPTLPVDPKALREQRSLIATKKRVPAYVVFGDAALRDMARLRPSTEDRFLEVKGVGQKKAKQYGQVVLETITTYCTNNHLTMDII